MRLAFLPRNCTCWCEASTKPESTLAVCSNASTNFRCSWSRQDVSRARMRRQNDPSTSIRLVAVDLDGTLLDRDKRVSRRTVEALCCLPRRAVQVVIASARPPRSVRHIYRALKLDTWQINYNGAMIWDE